MHQISLRVNGHPHELAVESRRTLADMLRHDLGYTGTHLGCEHGICGACTVLVDGSPVRSCLMFGVQADGCEVRTVEGLADGETLSDLQQAFSDRHALQCGFCTPGFLMLAEAYLAEYLGEDQTATAGSAPAAGSGHRTGRGLAAGTGERSGAGPGAGSGEVPGAGPGAGSGEVPGAGPGAGSGEGPAEAEVREVVAANLCRCTGYQGIVEAVQATARSRRAAGLGRAAGAQ